MADPKYLRHLLCR